MIKKILLFLFSGYDEEIIFKGKFYGDIFLIVVCHRLFKKKIHLLKISFNVENKKAKYKYKYTFFSHMAHLYMI